MKAIKTYTNVADVAQMLWQAQETGRTCAPVRDLLPDGDVDSAYQVQKINIDRRLIAGARLVGRKIGLTAKSVQAQLGVDQPDYGALLSDMVILDGGFLSVGQVLQPKAEVEIAFVLGRDLNMSSPTPADILRATAMILPAIEVVGSRIANWDIRLVDTVADNASSAMFVLGTPARGIEGFDFAGCQMRMTMGGIEVSTGTGSACLGNPVNAVAWLAAWMHEIGEPLREGEVILSGALGPMVALTTPGVVEAEITGLGRVTFEMEG
jgi:2-keto-4-pentenoate hydratase